MLAGVVWVSSKLPRYMRPYDNYRGDMISSVRARQVALLAALVMVAVAASVLVVVAVGRRARRRPRQGRGLPATARRVL